MILSCNHITKRYGEETIIEDVSFNIEDHEKAAIIGINGAGKSTLLKIITGEIIPDEGNVIVSKDKTVGYLSQHQDINSELSIYEYLLLQKKYLTDMEKRLRAMEDEMNAFSGNELDRHMEKYTALSHNFELSGGYTYKSEISGIINGLGFSNEEENKPVNAFSGGQKTRIALGALLLASPDIILLDEPTNHLDLNSIKWLESYLSNFKGAVVIVSHDRYFIDKTVTKIIEIENGKSTVYLGKYSDYSEKKAKQREALINLYIKQQKEIKHQEDVIDKLRSFKQEKFYKRAQSRQKILDKMDVIDDPDTSLASMTLTLTPAVESGKDVLSVQNLSKSYPGKELFKNISFDIQKGERVALIGNNGTGKTTILKILNKIVPADSGEFKLGTNVTIGYYDQEQQNLNDKNTLFDEIADSYPDLTNTRIRNVLAAFMFTGDDVFKTIGTLSGGEKGRLSLAKLMLSNANLIILDEPTNHLDIVSKDILENALNKYTGTLLYVSHDRYFINSTATRIIELTNSKTVNYIGNYDYYEEKKDELTEIYAPKNDYVSSSQKTDSSNKENYQKRKETQAIIRKTTNAISRIETEINSLEEQHNELDISMTEPEIATNSAKLNEIVSKQQNIQAKLTSLYEEWERLNSQLSDLNNQ